MQRYDILVISGIVSVRSSKTLRFVRRILCNLLTFMPVVIIESECLEPTCPPVRSCFFSSSFSFSFPVLSLFFTSFFIKFPFQNDEIRCEFIFVVIYKLCFNYFVHVSYSTWFLLFLSFTMENWFSLPADVSNLLDNVLTDTVSMGTPEISSGRTCGELWYQLPYSAAKYTWLHVAKIDTSWLAIMPPGDSCTIYAGYEEWEILFSSWIKRCKHWDGGLNQTDETHALLMNVHFVQMYEEVQYKC